VSQTHVTCPHMRAPPTTGAWIVGRHITLVPSTHYPYARACTPYWWCAYVDQGIRGLCC
jgi:hypothetical protein